MQQDSGTNDNIFECEGNLPSQIKYVLSNEVFHDPMLLGALKAEGEVEEMYIQKTIAVVCVKTIKV